MITKKRPDKRQTSFSYRKLYPETVSREEKFANNSAGGAGRRFHEHAVGVAGFLPVIEKYPDPVIIDIHSFDKDRDKFFLIFPTFDITVSKT